MLQAYYDRLRCSRWKSRGSSISISFRRIPSLPRRSRTPSPKAICCGSARTSRTRRKSAGDWLAGQIETMRKKVEDAEAKVEDFRAKANLLVGTNNTTLSAQQLGDLNAQLAAARAQKSDAEAKAKLIREMLHSGQPIEFVRYSQLGTYSPPAEQRVTLRAQLAEQSSTLLDNHPRIKELRAQIADLDGQIRAEADTRRAFARKRRQACRRPRRLANREPRSAQEPGGVDQRAGRAIARARTGCEIAARSARILSGEISRGEFARYHQFGPGRRPHRVPRDSVQRSGLSEEAAVRSDRRLCDAGAQLRLRAHEGDHGGARGICAGPLSGSAGRRTGAAGGDIVQRTAPRRASCRLGVVLQLDRRRRDDDARHGRPARGVWRRAGNECEPNRDKARARAR